MSQDSPFRYADGRPKPENFNRCDDCRGQRPMLSGIHITTCNRCHSPTKFVVTMCRRCSDATKQCQLCGKSPTSGLPIELPDMLDWLSARAKQSGQDDLCFWLLSYAVKVHKASAYINLDTEFELMGSADMTNLDPDLVAYIYGCLEDHSERTIKTTIGQFIRDYRRHLECEALQAKSQPT